MHARGASGTLRDDVPGLRQADPAPVHRRMYGLRKLGEVTDRRFFLCLVLIGGSAVLFDHGGFPVLAGAWLGLGLAQLVEPWLRNILLD